MAEGVLISIEVPAETGTRLDALVRATKRDRTTLVLEAIERLVAEDSDRLARVAEGFDEADAGAGVDGERVHGWMRSWFTDDELPRP